MPGTADTFTTSNRLDKQPTGGNYNQWGVYLNTNFDLVDVLKDGNLQLSMTGTTQHTLTTNNGASDEARYASITLIGTLTATGTVTAPNVPKLTVVENITIGGYPVVWTNGTGTSLAIQNGDCINVQCDAGGNMRPVAGNNMFGRTIRKVGNGTASDDAVTVGQVGTLAMGMPTLGTANQIIKKNSSTNADASWTDAATFLGSNGVVTQGLESIFVPAKAFSVISSNGGTATSLMCSTSSRMVDSITFGSATTQYASFTIEKMPKSWDRQNVTVEVRGFTTGNSGTGKVAMNVGLTDIVPAAAVDRPFNYSGDLLGTEASTASYEIECGSATASVSGGTASSGAGLGIMVRRNTTSTNQTLSGNFFFTGILVRYNNTLPNDS